MSHALFVLHEAEGKLRRPNTQETHQSATSHLPLTVAPRLAEPFFPTALAATVASRCTRRENAAVTKSIKNNLKSSQEKIKGSGKVCA